MASKQLILVGLPGAGMQAQGQTLAKRWQVPYISAAELVKTAAAQETPAGQEVRHHLESETPLPDGLMVRLMRKRFEQPDTMLRGWVLDGFPNTLAQAQAFDDWWAAVGQPAAQVAHLRMPPDLLIIRLLNEAGQHQPIAALRDRLATAQQALDPLLTYYGQQGRLSALNAALSAAEVARDLARLGDDPTAAVPFLDGEADLDALLARETWVVVDCMASWCGSCKQVSPAIDRLAETYGDRVVVRKLDFDAHRQISKRFELKGIPAVMFFKQGERQETLTGVKTYQDYAAAIARLLETPLP